MRSGADGRDVSGELGTCEAWSRTLRGEVKKRTTGLASRQPGRTVSDRLRYAGGYYGRGGNARVGHWTEPLSTVPPHPLPFALKKIEASEPLVPVPFPCHFRLALWPSASRFTLVRLLWSVNWASPVVSIPSTCPMMAVTLRPVLFVHCKVAVTFNGPSFTVAVHTQVNPDGMHGTSVGISVGVKVRVGVPVRTGVWVA